MQTFVRYDEPMDLERGEAWHTDELMMRRRENDELRSYQQVAARQIHRQVYLAILNPIDFDNHRFWHLVYQAGLQDMISAPAEAAGFTDVLSPYNLGFDVDATVCAPVLVDLVPEFRARLSSENYLQIKEILRRSLTSNSRESLDTLEAIFNPAELSHEFRETAPRNPAGPSVPGHNAAPGAVCPGFVGHPDFTPPSASNWMKILGGFMMALGAVAVVVAFAALNAATLGTTGLVVAGLGVASMLGGFGLFRMGASPSNPPPSPAPADQVICPTR